MEDGGASRGADYVLVGHIESFTLQDPGNPNLYVGTIRLRLKVVDTLDGSLVWSSAPPEAVYRWTASGHPDVPTPIFDIDAEDVRWGTLRYAARRLGHVFSPRRITRAEAQRRRRPRDQMMPE